MGLVKERENCHPQDLSFLSVIPRVSNFIHPVARLSSAPLSLSLSLSLSSGNRLRASSGYRQRVGPATTANARHSSCTRSCASRHAEEAGRRR